MRIIKILLGIILCLSAGYFTLVKLSLIISESYLLRDVNLATMYFLFLSLGVFLIFIGVKLILPNKKKKENVG